MDRDEGRARRRVFPAGDKLTTNGLECSTVVGQFDQNRCCQSLQQCAYSCRLQRTRIKDRLSAGVAAKVASVFTAIFSRGNATFDAFVSTLRTVRQTGTTRSATSSTRDIRSYSC